MVKGLHEPLITESKFHKIQNVLDGKVKGRGLPIAAPNDLPLRGFLKCPICSRKLTGSASKGRKTHVVYYHCKSPCKIRFNANALNRSFSEELRLFAITKLDKERLKQIILNSYDVHRLTVKETRKEYRNKMDVLDDQIIQAREFLMQGTIDATDFKAIKSDYQQKIELLQANLSELNNQFDSKMDMASLIEQALSNLSNLRNIYEKASVEGKRSLVGMIFLEPIVYDGEIYRTTLMNEFASLIYLKNKELQEQKKGEKYLKKTLFPGYGSFMVLINSRFVADLKRLADLKRKMDEMDSIGKRLKG